MAAGIDGGIVLLDVNGDRSRPMVENSCRSLKKWVAAGRAGNMREDASGNSATTLGPGSTIFTAKRYGSSEIQTDSASSVGFVDSSILAWEFVDGRRDGEHSGALTIGHTHACTVLHPWPEKN